MPCGDPFPNGRWNTGLNRRLRVRLRDHMALKGLQERVVVWSGEVDYS